MVLNWRLGNPTRSYFNVWVLCLADVVRSGRLRWFGHWVSKCRNLVEDRYRGRGRGRKKSMECVEEDMRDMVRNVGEKK